MAVGAVGTAVGTVACEMSDVWHCPNIVACAAGASVKMRYTSIFKGNVKTRAFTQCTAPTLLNCHSQKAQPGRLSIYLSEAKPPGQTLLRYTPRYVALTRPPLPDKNVRHHACVASHALSASILAAKETFSTPSFEATVATQPSVGKQTTDGGTRK